MPLVTINGNKKTFTVEKSVLTDVSTRILAALISNQQISYSIAKAKSLASESVFLAAELLEMVEAFGG